MGFNTDATIAFKLLLVLVMIEVFQGLMIPLNQSMARFLNILIEMIEIDTRKYVLLKAFQELAATVFFIFLNLFYVILAVHITRHYILAR